MFQFEKMRRGDGTSIAKIILVAFGVILASSATFVGKTIFDERSVDTKATQELTSASPSTETLKKLGVINASKVATGSELKLEYSDFVTGTKIFSLSGVSDTGALATAKIKSLKVGNVSLSAGTLRFSVGTEEFMAGLPAEVSRKLVAHITGNNVYLNPSYEKVSDGYVFMGTFNGHVSYGGTRVDEYSTASGNSDVEGFVLKVSETGSVSFLKRIGGLMVTLLPVRKDHSKTFIVTPTGDIVFIVSSNGGGSLELDGTEYSPAHSKSLFVRLSSNGTTEKAKLIESTPYVFTESEGLEKLKKTFSVISNEFDLGTTTIKLSAFNRGTSLSAIESAPQIPVTDGAEPSHVEHVFGGSHGGLAYREMIFSANMSVCHYFNVNDSDSANISVRLKTDDFGFPESEVLEGTIAFVSGCGDLTPLQPAGTTITRSYPTGSTVYFTFTSSPDPADIEEYSSMAIRVSYADADLNYGSAEVGTEGVVTTQFQAGFEDVLAIFQNIDPALAP